MAGRSWPCWLRQSSAAAVFRHLGSADATVAGGQAVAGERGTGGASSNDDDDVDVDGERERTVGVGRGEQSEGTKF